MTNEEFQQTAFGHACRDLARARLHTLRLPQVFWDDHYNRCEEHPGIRREVKRLSREVVVELDDEALADLRSDARHYACGGVEYPPPGLVPSARATLARLSR